MKKRLKSTKTKGSRPTTKKNAKRAVKRVAAKGRAEARIRLIFGTGNPEAQYEGTRHNTGFALVRSLAETFSDLSKSSCAKYGRQAVLGLPRVYVNQSGEAVRELARAFAVKPAEVLIVHDDADIPFPFVKLQFGADSAGHKGVESVIKALGTKKFWRLRVGIQPSVKKKVDAMSLVLKKFTPAEQLVWKRMRKRFPELAAAILEKGPARASVSKHFFTE